MSRIQAKHKTLLLPIRWLLIFYSASFIFYSCSTEKSSQTVDVVAKPSAPLPSWIGKKMKGMGIEYQTFESTFAHSIVSYHIYLPPQYYTNTTQLYPVLYWLHGSGGGEKGIPSLSRLYDKAIRTNKMPPMMIVFVNGLPNGMWCNSVDGRTPVESVLIEELIPYIDAKYRTIAKRDYRMIEGFSMGGYGAARLGFTYTNLFSAVSILGAGPLQLDLIETPRASHQARTTVLRDIYGNDLTNFRERSPWVIAEQNVRDLRESLLIRQVIGDIDETYPANKLFHDHLELLEIPHEYIVLSGVGHNPMKLIQALGDKHWFFYRHALNSKEH